MKRPGSYARKPPNFLAVMENRAPVVAGERDYFPTPPWAARAGGALIKRLDPAATSCWEPACGGGHMAHALRDDFDIVVGSDIEPQAGAGGQVFDFLSEDLPPIAGADWIVTNPPFVLAEAFVRRGLALAGHGVAMLCRLAFLETADRHALHYGATPLSVVAPFAERVPMAKGKWDPGGSTATAYAWFVWLTPAGRAASPLSALIALANDHGAALCLGIPPGRRDALTRPSDFERFAPPDAPLFGSETETITEAAGRDPPGEAG